MRPLSYLIIILSLVSAPAQAQNQSKKTIDTKNIIEDTETKLQRYDIDAATNLLDRWEEWLDATGKSYPDSYKSMRARAINTRNLLERVEKIELIDTMLVDSEDFFANYVLSESAGDLLDAVSLPDEYAAHRPKVVFTSQTGKEWVWAEPSAASGSRIVVSQVLDDGTFTPPESIGDAINEIGSTEYPFIQDDGMTIYFAAKGDNSLGGYDIFMTRRSADGELMQPQNIGMPFNSPFNDYMMVIDDAHNLGWWASDRSGIPGKVTIYIFRPSESRVNHDPDDDNILDFALLRNQPVKGDLEQYLTDKVGDSKPEGESFAMPMGNGKVYTSMSDFKSAAAARDMEDLLMKKKDMKRMQAELNSLRMAYGNGDKKKASRIKDLEKKVEELSATIKRLSNRVVSTENK